MEKLTPWILIIGFVLLIFTLGISNSQFVFFETPVVNENYLHHENEKGNIYSTQQYHANVGSGENRTLLIHTNSKQVHILEYSFVGSDAPQDLFLYEDPTLTSNGTLIQIDSRNRNLKKNATALIYSEPTVSNYGYLLDRDLLIGERKVGGQVNRVPYHWILDSNTSYLLVTKNRGGVDEQIVNVIWYEKNISVN